MKDLTQADTIDTPQMIEYCLSCPFSDCWNCLGGHNRYTYGLRMELDERFRNRQAKLVLKQAMANKGEGYDK